MKRAPFFGLVCALAVAFPACRPSPDDLVFVFGPVQDSTGARLADVEVKLFRRLSAECWNPEPFYGGSISNEGFPDAGTASVDQAPFEELFTDRTDGDGSFLFEMMVAETQTRYMGNVDVACFEARLDEEHSTFRFRHSMTDVEVPGMLRWQVTPQTQPILEGGVQVTVPELPTLPGLSPPLEPDSWLIRYRNLRVISNDQVAWVTRFPEDSSPTSTVDLRPALLEDFAELSAFFELGGDGFAESKNPFQSAYLPFSARVTSRTLPLGSTAAVPISRGASCNQTPCPYTDGELLPASAIAETPTGSIGSTTVTLTLPAPTTLGYAVIRNLWLGLIEGSASVEVDPPEVLIEGSSDGVTWVPLGNLGPYPKSPMNGNGAFLAGHLSGPAVSWVRLNGQYGVIGSLAEFSVFEVDPSKKLYEVR